MNFTIFSKLNIDNETDESALKHTQKYQQLANLMSQRYRSLNSVVPLVEDEEEAKLIGFSFAEFQQEFGVLNQEVNRYINEKERNLGKAIDAIRKYDDLFNKIEPVYQKYKERLSLISPSIESALQELQQEHSQHVNTLNAQWSTLQNKLAEQIEQGVQSLLEVKLTLGITGAFKGQITKEIKRNRTSEKVYFALFVLTLLLIPASIGGVYFIDRLSGLEWNDLLLIKLSIVIPLIWIAKWFSKNYAHARLASIKFDHLNRLLGEGASTIAKLVEADSEAKSEVYRRFAELFLDIKDLESIALSQPKHPAEDIKDAIELQRRLRQNE